MAKLPRIYKIDKSPMGVSSLVSMIGHLTHLSYSYTYDRGKYGRITFMDDCKILVTYRIKQEQFEALQKLLV